MEAERLLFRPSKEVYGMMIPNISKGFLPCPVSSYIR